MGAKNVTRRIVVVVASLALALVPTAAWAAPGDPDTSFDGDGFRTGDFAGALDEANTVLVQDNGRILAGGLSRPGPKNDFALFRLLANGTPDSSFSDDGFVTFDFRGIGGNDEVSDLAQQANGRIVAVGEAQNADDTRAGFAVARFRANGTLDPSFSGDGKLVVNFPGRDYALAFAVGLQGDGKILVAGETGDAGTTDWAYAVARITSTGAIDTTYGGGDGRIITNFANDFDGVQDLEVQPDGKLLAGGWSRNNAGDNFRHSFARYTTTGALDRTFSGDGKKIVDVSGEDNDSVGGLDIRPDGKIVAAGGEPGITLVRLRPNGSLDSSFSGDGIVISEPGPEFNDAVMILAGTKPIVASYTTDQEIFLARYKAGGGLDPTFGGGDGFILATVPGAANSRANAVTIQPNGRLVVAGDAVLATRDFIVARFRG